MGIGKKKLFYLFFFITIPVFAQDNTIYNFNIGNLGFGGNFPLAGDYNSEVTVTFLNFGAEHKLKKTNIGVELSPINGFGWPNTNEIEADAENEDVSLANVILYWNIFNHKFLFSNIYFGPFTSVNYLFTGENVYWNKFIFAGGLRAGYRINLNRLNYNIFSAELGYRNINGVNKFFVGGKIDILTLVILIASMQYSEHKEDNRYP